MDKFERKLNNGLAYVWLAVAILCLCGVVFKGAYWHIATAAISFLMYKMMFIPKDKEQTE
ncbi:MAG: hypothetical protein IJQ79_10960 [Bacteroidales bacterium]|nr:hypothetical protein [Bacteroidales bacterium]